MQLDKKWRTVFCLTIATAALTNAALAEDGAGCSRTAISMTVSPDDTWVALVRRDICSDGFFVTTVVNTVQLLRYAAVGTIDLLPRPELPTIRENDVFAVEGPTPKQRPLIRWLANSKLQITVPNLSLIGLKKDSYEKVDIIVKFEPDDPGARERWLRERGLKPK
jgi:hypothetical protein